MRSCLAAAVALISLTGPALASPTCYITYTEFEELVPHFDTGNCPERIGDDPAVEFCRMVLDKERVHVHHFIIGEDEACLTAIKTYDFNEFVGKFGATFETE